VRSEAKSTPIYPIARNLGIVAKSQDRLNACNCVAVRKAPVDHATEDQRLRNPSSGRQGCELTIRDQTI
jgi:hypothetical protein